jgi:hypothetical protein
LRSGEARRAPRGDTASDLKAGKVVQKGDRLLMSRTALVRAVGTLVDDVLSRDTIAAAAASTSAWSGGVATPRRPAACLAFPAPPGGPRPRGVRRMRRIDGGRGG